MKPLKTELQDAETLRDLGSASVQIVHDLKNQLNGLKLYATFLRKRMEKAERPSDEQETVAKLIAGLERAAADMNVLVRFGRPLELRRQPGTDLARLVADSTEGTPFEMDGGPFEGDFDPALLAEALKSITDGRARRRRGGGRGQRPARPSERRRRSAARSSSGVGRDVRGRGRPVPQSRRRDGSADGARRADQCAHTAAKSRTMAAAYARACRYKNAEV